MSEAQKEQQKNQALKGDPQDFYPKLLIHKSTRRFVMMSVIFSMLPMTLFVLYHNQNPQITWPMISIPIILVGLLLSLLPMSEEWSYRPWQQEARHFEKHFRFKA